MDTLSTHVEFLLRTHDCVVLPGFGSFICNSVSARFSDDRHTIFPPGRSLAFNPMLSQSDGLLTSSIARKNGISFNAASRIVDDEIAHLRSSLHNEGSMRFGHIGIFKLNDDGVPMLTADKIA